MLDKFRETAITWDKANRKVYEPLRVSAGDNKGRKLSVQVVNGGVVENITGSSLSLFWETRDKAHRGLDVFTAVDATKGEFEIYYTTGMLSSEGVLNANLVLVDTSGRVVSEPFTITVFKGIDDDAIQSSDSFTALTEALVDISNLEQNYAPRLNDLSAQLAHIVTLDVENFKTESNTYQQAITLALNEVNNTSTIQQWKIILPNKEILVSSSFYLKSNTVIDLNGCVLKKASGEDFNVFVTSEPFLENVSIINGTLNGNGLNMTGAVNGRFLLIETPSRNISVDGITVINNRSYIITISESEDITVQNCRFINDDVPNRTVALLLYMPTKKGNKRVRVLNNYLYNIAGDNIVVGGTPTFKGSDVIIQGNIIEKPCAISESGVKLGAIQCEGGSAKESIGFENIIISNNIVKEMGAGGTATDGIKVASGKNVIISDNIIVGTSYGIGTGQSEYIDIHDNIIEAPTSDGIYFTQISKVIKVHDNIIENPNFGRVGTSAGVRYIVTEGTAYNDASVIIEHNYILLSEKLLQSTHTRGVWVWSAASLTTRMGNVSIRFNEVVDKTGDNYSYAYKIQDPNFINYIVEGNEHLKTKIRGTATIPTGSNTVNVSHGLIITGKPLKYIMVTGGNAQTSGVYVLDPAYAGGSQIRFRTTESVTTDSTIYWEAEVQF